MKEDKHLNKKKPPFITLYSNALPNINSLLYKYHPVLITDNRLKQIFSKPFRAAYRQDRNLKDILFHAKLKTHTLTVAKPCNSSRCKISIFFQTQDMVRTTASDYANNITSSFKCASLNIVYCLECGACKKENIEETCQQIFTRLNEHRTDITNKLQKSVAEHFNQPGHFFDNVMSFILKTYFYTHETESTPSRTRSTNSKHYNHLKQISHAETYNQPYLALPKHTPEGTHR